MQSAERVKTEDHTGCAIGGICFVEKGGQEVVFGLTFVANADEDMAAKEFRSVEGQCIVYLYSTEFRDRPFRLGVDPSPIWLNEQPTGVIGWDETKYYLWHLAPGRHRIAASHKIGTIDSIYLTNPIDLDCRPGDLLFFNLAQVNVGNVFAGYHLETSLAEIKNATGRADIQKRELALDRFSHRLQPNFVDATASKPAFVRARAGDAEAQYLLGTMYLRSRLVLPNGPEALKWLGLAAEQHHADAMHLLGEIYRRGRSRYRIAGKGVVKRDKVEALKWFILASEQGHEEATAKVEKRKGRNYWDRSVALALEWNAAH